MALLLPQPPSPYTTNSKLLNEQRKQVNLMYFTLQTIEKTLKNLKNALYCHINSQQKNHI